MKSNHSYEWKIELHGGLRMTRVSSALFVGTVDAALSEADVMESGVEFLVKKIVLMRGIKTAEGFPQK